MTRCERSMVAPDECECRLARDLVLARWMLADSETPLWLLATELDALARAVHDA